MTDQDLNEPFKTITETSVAASTAMSEFLSHAFCVLAQQPCIDRDKLLEGLRSLSPTRGDNLFQNIYNIQKTKILDRLEGLYHEKSS